MTVSSLVSAATLKFENYFRHIVQHILPQYNDPINTNLTFILLKYVNLVKYLVIFTSGLTPSSMRLKRNSG